VDARAAELRAAEATKLSAARQRDLESAISSITKAYGEGQHHALRGCSRGEDRSDSYRRSGRRSGAGCGRLARGRVVEIFGPESSGKTTLMLHVIANAQRSGGLAAFIDAEHALDPGYARRWA